MKFYTANSFTFAMMMIGGASTGTGQTYALFSENACTALFVVSIFADRQVLIKQLLRACVTVRIPTRLPAGAANTMWLETQSFWGRPSCLNIYVVLSKKSLLPKISFNMLKGIAKSTCMLNLTNRTWFCIHRGLHITLHFVSIIRKWQCQPI